MIQRSEWARNAHGKRWGGWQPSRPAPAPRNRESEPGASPGFVLVDLPALHHETDVLERRDVALWIALDGDQVREGLALGTDHLAIDWAALGGAALGHVLRDVERGAPEGAPSLGEGEQLVVESIAMLDGVHARAQRVLDAVAADGVGGDPAAQLV